MFQFPGLATQSLCIQQWVSWYEPRRFPDSEISGSTLVSSSPKLIAAVHVLRRLSTPRHPPCALHSLTVSLRHDSFSQLENRVGTKSSRSRQPRSRAAMKKRTIYTLLRLFDFQRVVLRGNPIPSLVPASVLTSSSQVTGWS